MLADTICINTSLFMCQDAQSGAVTVGLYIIKMRSLQVTGRYSPAACVALMILPFPLSLQAWVGWHWDTEQEIRPALHSVFMAGSTMMHNLKAL